MATTEEERVSRVRAALVAAVDACDTHRVDYILRRDPDLLLDTVDVDVPFVDDDGCLGSEVGPVPLYAYAALRGFDLYALGWHYKNQRTTAWFLNSMKPIMMWMERPDADCEMLFSKLKDMRFYSLNFDQDQFDTCEMGNIYSFCMPTLALDLCATRAFEALCKIIDINALYRCGNSHADPYIHLSTYVLKNALTDHKRFRLRWDMLIRNGFTATPAYPYERVDTAFRPTFFMPISEQVMIECIDFLLSKGIVSKSLMRAASCEILTQLRIDDILQARDEWRPDNHQYQAADKRHAIKTMMVLRSVDGSVFTCLPSELCFEIANLM